MEVNAVNLPSYLHTAYTSVFIDSKQSINRALYGDFCVVPGWYTTIVIL